MEGNLHLVIEPYRWRYWDQRAVLRQASCGENYTENYARGKVWSTLDHPNVTLFLGVCYEDEIGGHRISRIVSEFNEGRTLKDNLIHIQNDRQHEQQLILLINECSSWRLFRCSFDILRSFSCPRSFWFHNDEYKTGWHLEIWSGNVPYVDKRTDTR